MNNSPRASALADKFILQDGTVSIAKMEVHAEALDQTWVFAFSLRVFKTLTFSFFASF